MAHGSGNNTVLSPFYYPWPNLGVKLSRQWGALRSNTEKEAPLIRAAYVDPQPVSANQPGEHDLSGWAIGERDFRNKFRIWYDKDNDRFSIQYNSGTEAVEIWNDYLSVRQVDGRVTIHGYGGLDATAGGFYTPMSRNLAKSGVFSLSREWQWQHDLNTKPILWDTFNLEDKSIIPLSVDVSNPNIAYFYFSQDYAGRAIAVAEVARSDGIRLTDGTNNYTQTTIVSFNNSQFYLTHGLEGFPTVNLQPTATGAAHADLSGLTADDHSQYLLASAATSRAAFATNWTDLTDGGATTLHSHASSSPDPGFYGIYVRESDGNPPTFRNDTVIFDSEYFYLQGNSVGKPIVSLRPPASSGSGVSAHSALSGLTADDHTQYSLADGTRAFTGVVAGVTPTGSTHLTTKGYVDGVVGPGFYGIVVRESDGNPPPFRNDTLTFDSTFFYLTGSGAGNKPLVSLRASVVGAHSALTGLTADDHTQYLLASAATDRTTFATNWTDLTDGGETSLHSHAGGGGGGGGFYGIIIRESDGNPPAFQNDTLTFDSTFFYLTGAGAGNKPLVSLRKVSIGSVVEDTTPKLGGDLNVNTFSIIGKPSTTANGNAGDATIVGGAAPGSGRGGNVVLTGGTSASGAAGNININAGAAGSVAISATGGVSIDSSALTMNNQKITDLAAPTSDNDAVRYIDLLNIGAGNFYGVNFRESDGTPPAIRNDTLIFDSGYFYLQANSVGKPIVSLRPPPAGATVAHATLSGLTADDHTQYLLASQATDRSTFTINWLDLTDGGETSLHSHAGGGGGGGGGFYGIVWRDSRVTKRTDRLSFNGAQFYLDGSLPTVNLGDNQTFATVGINQYAQLPDAATPTTPAAGNVRIYGSALASTAHSTVNLIDSNGNIINMVRDRVLVVKNSTGSSIPVGSFVSVVGSTGSTPNIVLAQANSRTTSAHGITMEVIANNAFGRIMLSGLFTGVDLSAFAEGNILYLSPTVAGGATVTEPTHPNLSQVLGTVNRANANGIMTVQPGNADGDDYGSVQTSYTIGATAASSVILQPASTAQRTATFQDKSGTVAYTSDLGPGFYGVYFRESDGNPPANRNDTLTFDSTYFYMTTSGAGNKPLISLRPTQTLTVRDIDLTPSVTNVTTIEFTNGSVSTTAAGVATVTITGGSGISTLTISDQSFGSQTTLGFNKSDFYLSGGATSKVLNLRDDPQIYKGHQPGVVKDNYFIEPDASHTMTVTDADMDCRSGTMTVGFYIITAANLGVRGIPVTGMDPVTIGQTRTKSTATGNNTLNIGDRLVLSIYGAVSADHFVYTVRLKKTT